MKIRACRQREKNEGEGERGTEVKKKERKGGKDFVKEKI